LDTAKNWRDEKEEQPKDGICVFGQVLRWTEFSITTPNNELSNARQLAKDLQLMIEQKEASRSILERIKRVAREYEYLSERAAAGQLPGPKVHKLFYTMRTWKTEGRAPSDEKTRRAKLFEAEIKQFSKDLLYAYQHEKKMAYPKYPVAARWAEFLTRKTSSLHDQL